MATPADTQVLQLFRKGGLKIGAKTEVIILKIVRHFALRLFKKAPWYSFPLLRHPSLVTSPGFMVEDMISMGLVSSKAPSPLILPQAHDLYGYQKGS